jgi:hypothetical protein
MKTWPIIILLFSTFAFAQEQLVLRVNENGVGSLDILKKFVLSKESSSFADIENLK